MTTERGFNYWFISVALLYLGNVGEQFVAQFASSLVGVRVRP
jgi:hypothetical protein